jgi:hypothetical protein
VTPIIVCIRGARPFDRLRTGSSVIESHRKNRAVRFIMEKEREKERGE